MGQCALVGKGCQQQKPQAGSPYCTPLHLQPHPPLYGGDRPGAPHVPRSREEGSLTLGRVLLLQPSGCTWLTPTHRTPGTHWAGGSGGRQGGLAPEPSLSAVGLGSPHSWEPSVGFCWQTECSFHVKRLVQYVSS